MSVTHNRARRSSTPGASRFGKARRTPFGSATMTPWLPFTTGPATGTNLAVFTRRSDPLAKLRLEEVEPLHVEVVLAGILGGAARERVKRIDVRLPQRLLFCQFLHSRFLRQTMQVSSSIPVCVPHVDRRSLTDFHTVPELSLFRTPQRVNRNHCP